MPPKDEYKKYNIPQQYSPKTYTDCFNAMFDALKIYRKEMSKTMSIPKDWLDPEGLDLEELDQKALEKAISENYFN